MSISLMYHGLHAGTDDLQRIDVEDRPYAVDAGEFEKQLTFLKDLETGLLPDNAMQKQSVILTFDDGHVSNFDRALPALLEAGIPAYFFITSDFVDQRKHFCTSAQLREMADAGMVIGAHGKTHGFFADMTAVDAIAEFEQSKKFLEDAIGRKVESMSFPGGRYNSANLQQAKDAGYQQVFGSGFGKVEIEKEVYRLPVNRIPLRASTEFSEFVHMAEGNTQYFAKQRMKTSSKQMLKRLIGNRRYHALYQFAAERR